MDNNGNGRPPSNSYNQEECFERITHILDQCKDNMIEMDSLMLVIALEDEVSFLNSLINLLREGKIVGEYHGDKDKPLNPDDFTIEEHTKQGD